ncbi:MAG TPA: cyclase family protein [Acidimicrobiales bacterium]|jgi:kynurenine formamidase
MAYPGWFHRLAKKVNNWGRWGPDDEVGTINLITPEVRTRAVACARTGRSFSLALPLSESEGIQTGMLPGRLNPVRAMVQINNAVTGDPSDFCSSDDMVVMGLQCATHWDGLAHVSYDGRMYNGYPTSSVTAFGASLCGIHRIRTLVSRGVLLDVARTRGATRLDGGYAITAADLDAAEARAGLEVRPGDVVLVRTGHMELLARGDKATYGSLTPGLSTKTVEWFRDRDVAAVATDTLVFEVWPSEDDAAILPVHLLHLVEMGMIQGQNWVLDHLAEDCAADGVYEFLLEASPQPFTNAVGSPVNPVAVK